MKLNKAFKKTFAAMLSAALLFSFAACTRSSNTPEDSSSGSDDSSGSSSSSSSSSSSKDKDKDKNLPKIEIVDKQKEAKDAQNINKDVVAYLTLPNTDIDEPVVKPNGTNNDPNYLRYKWDRSAWAEDGCYFVDYRDDLSSRSKMTKNATIYGHNIDMKDNKDATKFSQLFRFLDEDFAKKTPYIYVSTPTETMVFQIFATFYTNSTAFHYNVSDFKGDEFEKLVENARSRSEWNYKDVDVDKNDKILTLSTCTYKFQQTKDNPYRFVVMGKLLDKEPKGEATANIEKNPKIKGPDEK